ncbi:diacylglycerol/lipid kinase family protein [Arcanobacterium hippocoleae]|nr:diacylglycerol kinase family protein [Arcanobacterium hippocoleae]
MNWDSIVAILALIAASAALFLCFLILRRMKRAHKHLRKVIRNISPTTLQSILGTVGEPDSGPAYVVYNPTKEANWEELRKYLLEASVAASLPEPVWLETTAEDPGPGQTRKAIAAGASVVIAAGGDGTVRAVAEELAGTNTPLGLLPVGTGNLLARNLDLPLNSPRDMASIALTGSTRPIDVGWIEIADNLHDERLVQWARKEELKLAKPGKYAFIVISGMGFDADVMDSTSSSLKDKVGWLAYVSAGMKNLFADKMHVAIHLGDSGKRINTEARSVMLMNCGELTGGIVLDPNVDPSDSWLELAVLNIKGGVFGWVDLVRRVLAKNLGVRDRSWLPENSVAGDLDTLRVRTCTVHTGTLQAVQIDGDVLGYTNKLSVSLDPGALHVRVRK